MLKEEEELAIEKWKIAATNSELIDVVKNPEIINYEAELRRRQELGCAKNTLLPKEKYEYLISLFEKRKSLIEEIKTAETVINDFLDEYEGSDIEFMYKPSGGNPYSRGYVSKIKNYYSYRYYTEETPFDLAKARSYIKKIDSMFIPKVLIAELALYNTETYDLFSAVVFGGMIKNYFDGGCKKYKLHKKPNPCEGCEFCLYRSVNIEPGFNKFKPIR
jgi:hypothetical protein